MHVRALVFLIGMGLTTPAVAQVALVQAAKDELHAHGIPTENVGPCGPFQIVNLAAFRHGGDLGVLEKSTGTNCEWPAGSGRFYSSDWLIFSDGSGGDQLIGAETENRPAWNVEPHPDLITRWRRPLPPIWEVPTPSPAPAPAPEDSNAQIMAELIRTHADVVAMAASLEAHRRVSRDWFDRTLTFLKNPKTIAAVLGVLAGKFVIPGH